MNFSYHRELTHVLCTSSQFIWQTSPRRLKTLFHFSVRYQVPGTKVSGPGSVTTYYCLQILEASGMCSYLDAAKRSIVPSPVAVVHHAEIVHLLESLNGDRIGQNILRGKIPQPRLLFRPLFPVIVEDQ